MKLVHYWMAVAIGSIVLGLVCIWLLSWSSWTLEFLAGAIAPAIVAGAYRTRKAAVEARRRAAASKEAEERSERDLARALDALADLNLRLRTAPASGPLLDKAERLIDSLSDLVTRLTYDYRDDLEAIGLRVSAIAIATDYLPGYAERYLGLAPDLRMRAAGDAASAFDALQQEVTTVTAKLDLDDLSGATDAAALIVARFGRQDFITL